MSGTFVENRNLSYSLYSGVENYQQSSNTMTWGGSMQQNTAKGTLRGSYSQGSDYKQAGLGISGTLLIHPGGALMVRTLAILLLWLKRKVLKGLKLKMVRVPK